jgi:hypothetical protein
VILKEMESSINSMLIYKVQQSSMPVMNNGCYRRVALITPQIILRFKLINLLFAFIVYMLDLGSLF